MGKLLTVLLMLAVASNAHSNAEGPGTPEPVNLLTEPSSAVGSCPGGGTLAYPSAPYKGSAYFLPGADATFATRHRALTMHSAPWLQQLNGPSGANRLFIAATGERAIVFWTCKAGACDTDLAYGAYAPRSADYMLQIHGRAGSGPGALGSTSPTLAEAIACARTYDERTRDRAAQALKSPTRR